METTMSATILTAPLAAAPTARSSKARWTARIITGFITLFLAWDAAIKLIGVKEAIEGSAQLGFSLEVIQLIGVIEIVCLVLYLIPRTAPLGALLWTAYFGGAVVTHLRVGNPLFTHVLSGVYAAALIWIPLYLRDPRVRNLVRSSN
jgi:hypothetical protein